jgi:RimJ/RimL family protein N-acetyltransferase
VEIVPFPHPPLVDDVVRLRPWAAGDVEVAHRATQDPLIDRFTRVPANQTRDDVGAFIDSREPARLRGETLSLVIAARDDDVLVGTVSLMGIDWDQRRADIGYWLASWARGRGVATRAVRLLSRWALGPLGLARVQIGTYPENYASAAVARRCGFVEEGVLRSYLEVNGQRHDLVLHSLLSSDLTAGKPDVEAAVTRVSIPSSPTRRVHGDRPRSRPGGTAEPQDDCLS